MRIAAENISRYLPHAALWAWLLLCVVLPINGAWVPVPMALATLLGLACWTLARPRLAGAALWPYLAWYLLHVVGMAWTTDIAFGSFDLQVKLGLLLLPIAAAALVANHPELLRWSMVAFTIGVLLSMVLGFHKGYQCWSETGQWGCFSQSTLSFELHPSYAAWYASWALLWWGHRAMQYTKGRAVALLLVALLLGWTVLLASKSGLLSVAVVAIFTVVSAFSTAKGRSRWMLLATAGLLLVVASVLQGPVAGDRLRASINAVQRALSGDATMITSSDSNDLRLMAWRCSVARLEQEPFGAGTGDIKHALMDCYEAEGAVEAASRKLNSHSQFLQGAVALGWPGLLLSALLVLVPLAWAWRGRRGMLIGFLLLFLVNAAVESVLEVQAGVLFVGLFIGMLVIQPRSSHEHIKPLRSQHSA